MRSMSAGLWRQPDFLKLWAGETISVFGSQITLLALPLTAVLVLGASPAEMGILSAVEFAPFLVLSLFVGVWVDRLPRRPVLIIADIGRVALLGSIPVTYSLGGLSIGYLYLVGVLTGIMTVFFDVAYQAYLPSLVEREQLVEGNGKLEVSRSVAQIAGPGVAGTLVQLITAPVAIAFDALSFLASAIFIGFIRKTEPVKVKSEKRANIWAEIGEGLGVVFGSKLLRSIAGSTGTSNLFGNVGQSVFTIYVIREQKIEPAILGLIYGVGSIGALLGALLAGSTARRFGVGPTLVVTQLVGGLGLVIIPFASGSLILAIPLLIVAQFITSLVSPIYNITQVSLRQAITPHRIQGRMNASMRFLVWGTIPIGSLIGGVLGELIGLRATLVVAAVGAMFSFLWVLLSPVRSLREQPQPVAEEIGSLAKV